MSRAANHSALRCLVLQSELSRPILEYAEGAHPLGKRQCSESTAAVGLSFGSVDLIFAVSFVCFTFKFEFGICTPRK